MRPSTLALLAACFLFTLLQPCLAVPVELPADELEHLVKNSKLARVMSSKQIKGAVKELPKTLKLGQNDFLGSGVRRKSISGAYASTAGVGLGGAGIWYQTTNLKAKDRDYQKKKLKDVEVKQAICSALRRKGKKHAQVPTSVIDYVSPKIMRRVHMLKRRGLTDAGLNGIEDYNKMLAATEAIVGGSIAVTAAQQAHQRSVDASSTFRC